MTLKKSCFYVFGSCMDYFVILFDNLFLFFEIFV